MPTRQVVVRVDGHERQVTTMKSTVQTVLHQEGIALSDHDLIEPALTTPVTEKMAITVHRVTYEVLRERTAVPQSTVERFDRRMTVRPVEIHPGRPGVALTTRCQWKKDGEVAVQWVSSRQVIVPPVPRVVIRGKLASRGITGRRVLQVVATAYDPGPGSCGASATGHTAIGLHAGRGIVAVDPHVIPLGSRVYVEGYGAAIAADVGSAIKGHRIDVCFPTRGEALQWGRRQITVVVLE